jgi:hypothetical protein
MATILTFALSLPWSVVVDAQMRKYVDANGVTFYTNEPVEESQQPETQPAPALAANPSASSPAGAASATASAPAKASESSSRASMPVPGASTAKPSGTTPIDPSKALGDWPPRPHGPAAQ